VNTDLTGSKIGFVLNFEPWALYFQYIWLR
jgi:hypothetical protein